MYRGKNYLTKQEDKTLFVDTDLYIESLEKLQYNTEEELEEAGYVEVARDNSYNYEDKRDLSNSMLWVLYMRKNPRGKGFNYAVAIYSLNGGDPRGWSNYTFKGIFKTNENCFRYMIWLCDAWHMLSNRFEYHIDEIETMKKTLI